MKTGWIIGIVIVVIVIIGAVFLFRGNYGTTTPPASSGGTGGNAGGTGGSTGNTGGTGPKTVNVDINNFAFNPSSISVNVGDTVVWTNSQAGMSHTVTSDSGSELGSSTLPTGQTYSHTFNTAGTFAYHCSIHTSMHGTVTVA